MATSQRRTQPAAAGEPQAAAIAAVREHGADLGLGWDGDFDRCFFFDEKGEFIEGYYVVGLLAEAFLQGRRAHARIVHDPRLTWNTVDIVESLGGEAIQSKTGHAFIKERMRTGKRRLRRRDERPPLLPRLRVLRQRHDSLVAGGRAHVQQRGQTLSQTGGGAHGGLSLLR